MLEGAKLMGAGAATIASAGAAIGIGNVLSSSIHSVARNPSLAKQSFGYVILGFALTEAIALFAPMMVFFFAFGFEIDSVLQRASIPIGMRFLSFFLIKLGCSGGLSFAIGFTLRALLATEATYMAPSGSAPVASGGDKEVTSENSFNWRDLLSIPDSGSGGELPERDEGATSRPASAETGPSNRYNAESSRPTVSRQGSIPGENEPGAQPGAPVPSSQQVEMEITSFINSFRQKRRAPCTMIQGIAEEIGLAQASAAKRQAIMAIMDAIRDHPNSITGVGVINSGENARAELTERLGQWIDDHNE